DTNTITAGAITQNTTYTLSGTDISGNVSTKTASVLVNAPAPSTCNILTFGASNPTVNSGGTSDLSYTATGCQSIILSGGQFSNFNMPTNAGLITATPTQTTTYTLTGTDASG